MTHGFKSSEARTMSVIWRVNELNTEELLPIWGGPFGLSLRLGLGWWIGYCHCHRCRRVKCWETTKTQFRWIFPVGWTGHVKWLGVGLYSSYRSQVLLVCRSLFVLGKGAWFSLKGSTASASTDSQYSWITESGETPGHPLLIAQSAFRMDVSPKERPCVGCYLSMTRLCWRWWIAVSRNLDHVDMAGKWSGSEVLEALIDTVLATVSGY